MWVPHLLTEEQKRQRLKCARELLKTYKGCNSRVISNLLTGDETWVHMFETQRRADNQQWKRKDKKRPCIAKRTISSKITQFSLIQVGQSFKCFLEISIRLEVLLAALFISVSNRYQKKTIYLLFAG